MLFLLVTSIKRLLFTIETDKTTGRRKMKNIEAFLIDCPYCNNLRDLDHCKVCDNKKKVHAVFFDEEYRAIIIYNREEKKEEER